MTLKSAKYAGIKYNATAGSPPTVGTDISPYCDKATLDRIIELIETTTFGSSGAVFKSRVGGIADVSLDMAGSYDTFLETSAGMETDSMAGTARIIRFIPDASVACSATNPVYSFTCLLNGFKGPEADVKGDLKWGSKAFISTSTLTRSTTATW